MPVIPFNPSLLKDARDAYHRLVTGTSARELVDQNGERVTFTAANRADLYSYIQMLESQAPNAGVSTTLRGPVGFIF